MPTPASSLPRRSRRGNVPPLSRKMIVLPMGPRILIVCLLLIAGARGTLTAAHGASHPFLNLESAPVHPLDLSPDQSILAACNLPDGSLELFDVTSGLPSPISSVPVGIDPVTVRFRDDSEAWVINHVSDSISIVHIPTRRVVATLDTLDTPADLVFAGSPRRAFVSCALPNRVQVFDPDLRQEVATIPIDGQRPKAMAVSPDLLTVYVAVLESGNRTTLVGPRFRNLLFFDNPVSLPDGPYDGLNPPPNNDDQFAPPLNPELTTNTHPPATGLIVRRNEAGQWLDDNQRDWTSYVSGPQAERTRRVPGWDLPDRDLAMIHTSDLTVRYATGLMNLCMALAIHPNSGQVAVLGSDAMNHVRFEPNLKGIFLRVLMALVDPATRDKSLVDLNPHLDYSTPTVPEGLRDQSIGDPRAALWTPDGSQLFVAGMGSRNVARFNTSGQRLPAPPIEVGEGPCGLALDTARHRLYVYNRFSSSLSVIDTQTDSVIQALPLFDPTPLDTAAGRPLLYDTRRTSGLGQAACASCHVDARTDRLAWDLGNPAGSLDTQLINNQGLLVTNLFHPMKGVMLTQTLQDIIGHEPFHWRGDRPNIQAFNATFTNLHGAPTALTSPQMAELRDFLAGITFPPNPYRNFDNSFPTNLPLPGHVALGDDQLSPGAPLPNGNARAGLDKFNLPGNFCATCHSLPTGLGRDQVLHEDLLQPPPPGFQGPHAFPLAPRLEGPLPSKISQFRNLPERVGMSSLQAESSAGFGFGHDGSIDSLTRFLQGVRIVRDQDMADLIAFLLSVSGSDTLTPGGPPDPSPPAAVGTQLTLVSSNAPPLFPAMIALAQSSTSRVDLVAKGILDGQPRGWWFDRVNDQFQSDRLAEKVTPSDLLSFARPGQEITLTVVAGGTGCRIGIDHDLDGILDQDERDAGSNPADPLLRPAILTDSTTVAVGQTLHLIARIPPMPAPGTIQWRRNGTALDHDNQTSLTLSNANFNVAGDYDLIVTSPYHSQTSSVTTITIAPLLAVISPSSQSVRRGSNALFTASLTGQGPFTLQWLHNGSDLTGAQGIEHTVTNAQIDNEGLYQLRAGNAFGTVTSPPASLIVLVSPTILIPPLTQQVVAGEDAVFSFTIDAHPPPFGYALRRSSTVLTNYVSTQTTGFLALPRVQPSDAGTYRIIVTNAASFTPGTALPPVALVVLDDTDLDGLPDNWETDYMLDPNNPDDAQLDADLDGVSNHDEYRTRTDPRDPLSYLRVEPIQLVDGPAALIRFRASSNTTYTLQYSDQPHQGPWHPAADVPAFATPREVTVTNLLQETQSRFYRLTTPHHR